MTWKSLANRKLTTCTTKPCKYLLCRRPDPVSEQGTSDSSTHVSECSDEDNEMATKNEECAQVKTLLCFSSEKPEKVTSNKSIPNSIQPSTSECELDENMHTSLQMGTTNESASRASIVH